MKSSPLGLLKDPRIRLLAVAIALGLLATMLVKAHVNRVIAAATGGTKVRVVSIAKALPAGEILDKTDLTLRTVPAEMVSQGRTVTEPDLTTAYGLKLRHAMRPGEILLWTDIDLEARTALSQTLEVNQRALTLNVSKTNSFADMINPGDRLDIISALRADNLRSPTEATVLLQNVLVLAVDGETRASTPVQTSTEKEGTLESAAPRLPAGRTAKVVSTVTVRVSPDEALKLVQAQARGPLTFLLRNRGDIFTYDYSRVTGAPAATPAPATDATVVTGATKRVPGYPVIVEEGTPVRSAFYPSANQAKRELDEIRKAQATDLSQLTSYPSQADKP